jgi:hypothetical protein
MNIPDIRNDPPRDPELAAALDRDPAMSESDWGRLHASILTRAELSLARLRLRPSWWDYAAGWARPAIPFAVAASLTFLFIVGKLPDPRLDANGFAVLPFLDDVLTATISDVEYDLLVADSRETDALLRLALQEP